MKRNKRKWRWLFLGILLGLILGSVLRRYVGFDFIIVIDYVKRLLLKGIGLFS